MAYDPQKNQQFNQQIMQDKLNTARERSRQEKSFQGKVNEFASGKRKADGELGKRIQHEARKVSTLMDTATPWGVMSILSQMNILSDWPYALALIAAILKDIFDLMEVTGIGYAIVIVFTFLCSIWIAMMMMLAPGSKGKQQQKTIRSWLILLSGTTAEMIFGIDLLPIETLTVLIIYALALLDRKRNAA